MSYRHSVSAEGLEKVCLQRWSDFLAGKLAVGELVLRAAREGKSPSPSSAGLI